MFQRSVDRYSGQPLQRPPVAKEARRPSPQPFLPKAASMDELEGFLDGLVGGGAVLESAQLEASNRLLGVWDLSLSVQLIGSVQLGLPVSFELLNRYENCSFNLATFAFHIGQTSKSCCCVLTTGYLLSRVKGVILQEELCLRYNPEVI